MTVTAGTGARPVQIEVAEGEVMALAQRMRWLPRELWQAIADDVPSFLSARLRHGRCDPARLETMAAGLLAAQLLLAHAAEVDAAATVALQRRMQRSHGRHDHLISHLTL